MGRIALALGALAAMATACGGGGSPPPTAPHPASAIRAASDAGVEAAAKPALASYDDLAVRGASSAPLMHAGKRLAWASADADAGAASYLRDEVGAPAALRFDRDTCMTVVFAASSPVRLWLEDESRAKRGDPSSGTAGALPPRGPACVKRGESVRVGVEGDGDVRAIVFTSP